MAGGDSRGQATRYAAFISYSRAVDGKLAPALRDALQVFGKHWYQRRALRVFLDKASLTANPGLWSSIEDALNASEWFVLLASPEAAKSPWVNREVEHWLKRKSAERLIIVVTEGEIVWDATVNDFDRPATTCIPPALSGVLSQEPQWVDLREARLVKHLSLRRPHFSDKVAEIAAPLHGVAKDDLVDTSLRRHRATKRLVAATIAVLTVLSVVATTSTYVANRQRQVAEDERRRALARQLMAQAEQTLASDPQLAARLGLAALSVQNTDEVRAGLTRTIVSSPIAATLVGTFAYVGAIAFAPNGAVLAVGGEDRTITLWDVRDPVNPTPLGPPVKGHTGTMPYLAFTPDSRTLVSYSTDGSVGLWDISDPARPRPYAEPLRGPTGWLIGAALHPAGQLLATVDRDGAVSLWDVANPAAPHRRESLNAPADPDFRPQSVAFTPDGRMLIAEGWSRTLLWNVDAWGDPVELIDWRNDGRLLRMSGPAVALAPDGRLFAHIGEANRVVLWDITDPSRPERLGEPLPGQVRSLAFSPDGHRLATGGIDGTLTVWDVTDPRQPQRVGDPLVANAGSLETLAFSADGQTVASLTASGAAIIWRVDGPPRPRPVADPFVVAPDVPVTSVAFAADNRLATGTGVGDVALWELTAGAQPRRLGTASAGQDTAVSVIRFAPNDSLMMTVDIGRGGAARLWDVGRPDRLRPLGVLASEQANSFMTSAVLRPDGLVAVTTAENVTRLWDIAEPTRPQLLAEPLPGRYQAMVEFSSDGRTLAVTNGQTVVLLDVSDPAAPRVAGHMTEPGGDMMNINAIAFARHAPVIAAATARRGVILWDVGNPAQPQQLGAPLLEHDGAVASVTFGQAAPVMATLGADGTVVLWDVTDPFRPRPLGPPLASAAPIASIAVADDGRILATGGTDGRVVLWDIGGLHDMVMLPTAWACTIAGRGLSREEWQYYLPGLPYVDPCAKAPNPR